MPRLLFVCLLAATLALAGGPAARADGRDVYKKIAPSTVWFFERGSATGVLVDADKRIVLTAEHVVRNVLRAGGNQVKVIFAQLDSNQNVLVEKSFYGFEKKRVLAISGRIIYANRLKDIALVQLERLPPGVAATALARVFPQPGDRIHVIGNSTFLRGGLFSYCEGRVRNSYYFDEFKGGNIFYSLAHHAPTNRGDSGGPVLNDAGELVGIISQGTTGSGEGEQVIDQSVHVREIRSALQGSNWPVVKSVTFTATAFLAGEPDRFYLPVRRGRGVSMALKGNGKTDLDLFARDFDEPNPKKQFLVAQTGLSDQESGQFTPRWSGAVEIIVQNLGHQGTANKAFTPRNVFTLDVSCGDGVRGPITVARPLAPRITDTARVYFEAGSARARVQVRGDGDTDLELSVLGPNDNDLGRGDGAGDRKQISFPVKESGYYTIRVQNTHARQYNSYVLAID
jgi:S1-C subfamily serine protease